MFYLLFFASRLLFAETQMICPCSYYHIIIIRKNPFPGMDVSNLQPYSPPTNPTFSDVVGEQEWPRPRMGHAMATPGPCLGHAWANPGQRNKYFLIIFSHISKFRRAGVDQGWPAPCHGHARAMRMRCSPSKFSRLAWLYKKAPLSLPLLILGY